MYCLSGGATRLKIIGLAVRNLTLSRWYFEGPIRHTDVPPEVTTHSSTISEGLEGKTVPRVNGESGTIRQVGEIDSDSGPAGGGDRRGECR